MSRLRAVVAATALLALAAAPAASAHQGNPNYRSIIDRVTPSVRGLQLQVLNFDDRLELQNGTSRPVTVQGYNGEPYARLLPDGTVQVNKRSPAYFLNNDRTGTEKVPASADPKAAPQWQMVDRAGRFQWHDHRIHWMGTGIPPQVNDQGRRTKVYDWNVPLEVGRQKGRIAGTLWWQPEPGGGVPVPAIVGFAALALLGLLAVVVVRRRRAGAPVEAW